MMIQNCDVDVGLVVGGYVTQQLEAAPSLKISKPMKVGRLFDTPAGIGIQIA
jgi:hypothetical protein